MHESSVDEVAPAIEDRKGIWLYALCPDNRSLVSATAAVQRRNKQPIGEWVSGRLLCTGVSREINAITMLTFLDTFDSTSGALEMALSAGAVQMEQIYPLHDFGRLRLYTADEMLGEIARGNVPISWLE